MCERIAFNVKVESGSTFTFNARRWCNLFYFVYPPKHARSCRRKHLRDSGNLWGVITAKIKFGILLCCLPMLFLIFSLVFWMLRIVFNVLSMMFAKMSLLFCCFCIRLFGTNNVSVVPYGVMRNLDAIIRVRMVLCETSMLLCFELCSS